MTNAIKKLTDNYNTYYCEQLEYWIQLHVFIMHINNMNNNDSLSDDTAATILKLKELESIYKVAKNDAMKLRRKLEGRKVVSIIMPRSNQVQQYEHALDQGQFEPQQQKRGRGRPRKIKESLELIRGDETLDKTRNFKSDLNSTINDEFINAVYSIEEEELYVKTKAGRFYDIETMKLRGWNNPYLKTNSWISYD